MANDTPLDVVPGTETLPVSHVSDVASIRRSARTVAMRGGFDHPLCEEIALVAGELATNLIKHAGKGVIRIGPLAAQDPAGILLESLDRGPGIVDIEQARVDGFSTSGSLGYGLGSVARLMDDLRIRRRHRGGIRVTCRRTKPKQGVDIPCPLDIGAATRCHPGMKLNGDAFVVCTGPADAMVAVIDGLGHGQDAHRAAQKARGYIERHFQQPLKDIFAGVERECRPTRGVVMTLARFDYQKRSGKAASGGANTWDAGMRLAGIGNIEARILGSSEPVRMMIRRGIVGKNAPGPLLTETAWGPGCILIMHSDGLSTHWKEHNIEDFIGLPASSAASGLLKTLDKGSDDATVAVVKWKDDPYE